MSLLIHPSFTQQMKLCCTVTSVSKLWKLFKWSDLLLTSCQTVLAKTNSSATYLHVRHLAPTSPQFLATTLSHFLHHEGSSSFWQHNVKEEQMFRALIFATFWLTILHLVSGLEQVLRRGPAKTNILKQFFFSFKVSSLTKMLLHRQLLDRQTHRQTTFFNPFWRFRLWN